MKKKLLFGLLLSAGLLFINASRAVEKPEVIARFLVSMARYIEWPGTMKTGEFRIGVIGDFKIYRAIAEETIGSSIQNRNVDVMNLTKIEHAGLSKLNVLVLSDAYSTSENIKNAIRVLGDTPTLIVTEKANALQYGSAINFVESNGKVGFELDKSNARRNGIQVSNQIDVFALLVQP